MKPFFLALAATPLLAASVAAQPTVNPQGGTDREAYAFRQCRKVDGNWGQYVCYNTKRTSWISIAGVLPVPITRTKYRTHRVNCRVPHPGDSLRSQVAAAYCPQLPGLAPAPFLSLSD